ncbi:lytic transglycosylase domain-containing protein [Ancylobacter sp. 6x-1]|uniref:Lytic transglycosylase domain-containing protein n=1 Tax=Ancylobacter crimeensis TaxID=2579147 RepID=A0ABT0DF54_9HYPH|nr:lytic transglycosylase domain-containing protein [Ancylobacter crimeensis]MCK0198599.1 lytic transglycosylase domain-containing protein [Ancylobacter crimeensis]
MPTHPALRIARLAACALLLPASPARAEPDLTPAEHPTASDETVVQALCRLTENAARENDLPVDLFTRLIWRESAFRTDVVSPKGAQGIAQFMPGTANERGLEDPFDPESALPASARFLAELKARFGNLGLAAAAYNAGPARVEKWLGGTGGLPFETEAYVVAVTGREAQDWADQRKARTDAPASASSDSSSTSSDRPATAPEAPQKGCLAITAELRKGGGELAVEIATITAPWGVQLSGNFSKARALAAYQRTRKRYSAVLEGTEPMVIGQRLRSRGSRIYYRVRIGSPTRADANQLCARLHAAGAACIVLPS